MVESLVITLREGIEAALVVGIILAYLRKTGKGTLNRFVYWGLGLAIAASLAVAAVFNVLDIDPENEVMEGIMLGVGGIFVASMVVWMWRTAGNIKRHMEEKLANIVSDASSASSLTKQGVGLLIFTFMMVFREGVETVLFLAAATVGELDVMNFVGGAIGIGLAVVFAIFFTKGSLRINLSRFFTVTGIVLLLLAIKLIAGSIHEFSEVNILPMSKEVMAVLGYFVRDESSMIILMALLVLPLLLVLWETQQSPAIPQAALAGLSAPERRKKLAVANRDRVWRLALVGATLVVVLVMGSAVVAGPKYIDPAPVPLTASAGKIHVPVDSLETGHLHKFSVEAGGTSVRFLAVKLDDGSIATGVDACQICGSAGYMQEGENAICKNCNAPIPMPTLGLGGGCNPLALKSAVEGANLVVDLGELEQAKMAFSK